MGRTVPIAKDASSPARNNSDRLGLGRHGAGTFLGLLTRIAATLLAHTLLRLGWA
jgi:hypothetical protein